MLELVVDRTQAWELLCDPKYTANLTMEGLYRLMVRAGEEESVARESAKLRGWNRLVAGEAM